MTVIALGLLAVALLICLYVLIGFPAEAQGKGMAAKVHLRASAVTCEAVRSGRGRSGRFDNPAISEIKCWV